ncbi:HAD family hydrolase [Nocardia neocaledoniensis]|uniref:HAD family hydrolase n=1 Tax=Nocardia neocaledoniensis TaxID=236511 RepID=UPI0024589A44|nr:HAD family phosphatase [Nocardia neocaledoniensis]
MSGSIEAVLFDLDGTLAATMRHWDCCWSDYAARHGHTWSEADRRSTHGHGDWAEHVAAVCGVDVVERVVDDCLELMVAQIRSGRIELLPGIPRLLATADAVVTGVVSASPRRFVDAAIDHFDLRRSMRVIVAREDHPTTKPQPGPWLHAADLLGIDTGSCVAVEDSAAGIRSAHAAGMRVLAIPSWMPTQRPPEADLAEHLAIDADHAHSWLHGVITETTRPSAVARI